MVLAACVHCKAVEGAFEEGTRDAVCTAIPDSFVKHALQKLQATISPEREAAVNSILQRAYAKQTDAVVPGTVCSYVM